LQFPRLGGGAFLGIMFFGYPSLLYWIHRSQNYSLKKIKQLHKQQSAKRMNQAGYAREKTEFQIRTIN